MLFPDKLWQQRFAQRVQRLKCKKCANVVSIDGRSAGSDSDAELEAEAEAEAEATVRMLLPAFLGESWPPASPDLPPLDDPPTAALVQKPSSPAGAGAAPASPARRKIPLPEKSASPAQAEILLPKQPTPPGPAAEAPRATGPVEPPALPRRTAPPPLPQTTTGRISRIPARRAQSQRPALDVGGAQRSAAVALDAPPWESVSSQEAPAQSSIESRVVLVTEASEQPSPSLSPKLDLPTADSKPASAIVQLALPPAIPSQPRASMRSFTPARPISVGVKPSRTGRRRWLPVAGLAVVGLLGIRACLLGTADQQQTPLRSATLDLGEPSFAATPVEHSAPPSTPVAPVPVLENASEVAAMPPLADSQNPPDGAAPPKPATAPRSQPARRAAQQPSASSDPPAAPAVPYDKATLAQALNAAVQKAEQCDLWGRVTGTAKLFVTFAPTGRVTEARLEGEPLASAAVARCILHQARAATLPPFAGPEFTVARKITLR